MGTPEQSTYEEHLRQYLAERDRPLEVYKPQFDTLKQQIENHISDFFAFLISDHYSEELYFGKVASPNIFRENIQQNPIVDYEFDHNISDTVATIESETILLYTRYSIERPPHNLDITSVARVLDLDYDGSHPFFLIPNQTFHLWTNLEDYLSQSSKLVSGSETLECYFAAGKNDVETYMEFQFDGSGALGYRLLTEMYTDTQLEKSYD